MSMFDITIDKDIDFLIKEIGKDIKINNEDTRAIINNVDNEFDDKEIITKFIIKQGMYVNYANRWWMVISESVDKRYNSYKKAIIRKCDNTIKFIINNKIYEYPVIFTKSDMALKKDGFWIQRGDFLKIHIPKTSISNQIKIQNRVLKFGVAYNVWGKSEARENIIELSLWADMINPNADDEVNEIADRYKDGKDVLGGNITPIMPFDEDEDILNKAIVQFFVLNKDTQENISDVSVTLTDDIGNVINILTTETHRVAKGTYTYTVTKDGYITVTDTIIIDKDTTKVIFLEQDVQEPEPEPSGYTYTITAQTVYPSDPDDEIYWNDTVIYTVHKFDNDVEVDGNFTFEVYQQNIKTKEWIQPSSISEVTNTTNNTINIKAIESKQGYIKLVATDTETNQIAIEKQIRIRGIM